MGSYTKFLLSDNNPPTLPNKTEPETKVPKIEVWFKPNPTVKVISNDKPENFIVRIENISPYKNFYKYFDFTEAIIRSGETLSIPFEYYIPLKIKVMTTTKKIIFEKNYYKFKKENILIKFCSKSLGDTLAWIPYVEEFRKIYGGNIYCFTFMNDMFKKTYPEIKFLEQWVIDKKPNNYFDRIYNLGVFYSKLNKVTFKNSVSFSKTPIDYRKIPLQKVACDILGLPYSEMRPIVNKKPETPLIINNSDSHIYLRELIGNKKYVCISEHSTAKCKYWNNPNGWQIIIHYLNSLGYSVCVISKEPTNLKSIIDLTGTKSIFSVINILSDCDFYIGVPSGLAWLAWAIYKPVIMISGFSKPYTEFKSENYRVFNKKVCNGCYNKHLFNKSDWNWCPEDNNFECSRMISSEMVIEKIKKIVY